MKLVLLLITLCTSIARAAEDKPFSHPGVLTSQREIDLIRSRVAAAKEGETIYEGYKSTMASKFADLNFTPKPVAHVQRNDGAKPDSPSRERNAAMTAYTLTLKWVITGDAAARDKAQSIMAAWADVFESHEGDINKHLDAAWVTTPWAAAGELMLHAKVDGKVADWDPAKVEQFKKMVRALEANAAPIITKPMPPGNWNTSAALGSMAAGVFLDDRAMYTRGRDYLLTWMPKIILKDGYTTEVFRDPWHGIVSLCGCIQAAEVGRHQDDLSLYNAKYDDQSEPRLLVSIKWYADPLRDKGVNLPPMGGPKWKTKPWTFTAKNSSRNTGSFEIALNYYQWIAKAKGLEDFRDAVLKTYRPSGQDNGIFISSDTLTHGDIDQP